MMQRLYFSVPITDGWQAEEWIEITLTYTVQIPHMAYPLR